MTLPFTQSDFIEIFRLYNEATWPVALLLPAFGIACAWLVTSHRPDARRVALVVLGVLWTWTALVYHLDFFARINPAARWFAVVTLAQAALFFIAATRPQRIREPRTPATRAVGLSVMLFALFGYPALGYLAGHWFPALPTFGLPCPTTIFTLGALAYLHDDIPWFYLVVPLGWAVVATFAALQLGMTEDLSLPLAAAATFAVRLLPPRRLPVRAAPLAITMRTP